jgi:hypothetical protein
VRDYLISQGIQDNAVSSRGLGKTNPIAPNETAQGRQKNRRVQIVVSGAPIGKTPTQPNGTPSQPNENGAPPPPQGPAGQPQAPPPPQQ